jgi:hypothetical protein
MVTWEPQQAQPAAAEQGMRSASGVLVWHYRSRRCLNATGAVILAAPSYVRKLRAGRIPRRSNPFDKGFRVFKTHQASARDFLVSTKEQNRWRPDQAQASQ